MEQILDQPLIEDKVANVKYAGFWPRLGALIIDGLVLAPLSIGVNYFNITSWKDPLFYVAITLLTLAYKPIMEFVYGATLGKMSFNLKVVNLKLENASLGDVLYRNVFHITPTLITLFLSVGIYQQPEFQDVDGYGEYSQFIAGFKYLQYINYLSAIILVIDTIVMLTDDRNRSLHDRIGGTFVIQKVSAAGV